LVEVQISQFRWKRQVSLLDVQVHARNRNGQCCEQPNGRELRDFEGYTPVLVDRPGGDE
jgi:hypothetical protein